MLSSASTSMGSGSSSPKTRKNSSGRLRSRRLSTTWPSSPSAARWGLLAMHVDSDVNHCWASFRLVLSRRYAPRSLLRSGGPLLHCIKAALSAPKGSLYARSPDSRALVRGGRAVHPSLQPAQRHFGTRRDPLSTDTACGRRSRPATDPDAPSAAARSSPMWPTSAPVPTFTSRSSWASRRPAPGAVPCRRAAAMVTRPFPTGSRIPTRSCSPTRPAALRVTGGGRPGRRIDLFLPPAAQAALLKLP